MAEEFKAGPASSALPEGPAAAVAIRLNPAQYRQRVADWLLGKGCRAAKATETGVWYRVDRYDDGQELPDAAIERFVVLEYEDDSDESGGAVYCETTEAEAARQLFHLSTYVLDLLADEELTVTRRTIVVRGQEYHQNY